MGEYFELIELAVTLTDILKAGIKMTQDQVAEFAGGSLFISSDNQMTLIFYHYEGYGSMYENVIRDEKQTAELLRQVKRKYQRLNHLAGLGLEETRLTGYGN